MFCVCVVYVCVCVKFLKTFILKNICERLLLDNERGSQVTTKIHYILSIIVNNLKVGHFLNYNLLLDNFGDPIFKVFKAILKYKNHGNILTFQNH